ncbi:LysR family transcriptional regulator [Pikeienuella piscinae]|uniref:LysR family transcriptional regulator n=1 Tax=Pikeienuella piscinae TaxID=2748098 RepID=A0A7L5C2T0_9RHOB|nr:LysR substrate-binding domain-containing protein [Pikeienuella piscinae]QIE56866.1 LysR family transcriptional regulator [Pikeienuella piscinae]
MSLSPPRGPGLPLTALRAFEAAARLGGFAAAAEELSVTPGAVAQQVKALEAAIGAKLFARRAQGVELTPLGASALGGLSAAFDRLGAAATALRAGAGPRAVRIAALPAIAQLWLSPRLAGLRQAAPEITVSVAAIERAPNLLREAFDIAVFLDEAEGAADALDLGADVIFPVAAPSVARRLRRPADLGRESLLSDTAWSDDWARWAAAVPAAPRRAPAGPVFSLYALAVEAAESGGGVLIGHGHLVRRQMKTGRLIAPFPERVATGRRLTLSLARPAAKGGATARIAAMLAAG